MARSSISSDIAKLSKQKTIPAVVTDVLGNFCSVRLSIRGTRLHGLKYLGTTPIIGETVYVNYQSGTPVVYTVTGNVDSSIASAVAQIPSSSSGRSVPLEPPMIPGINHNDLSGLQGGLVASDVVDAEHYHLDATEYADLTDGGETNLHQHSEYVEWWYDTVDPTGNDDIDRGYAKADIWINQTANKSFICIDNVAGNAAWQELGTNGGGSIVFKVDGVLAVVDEATNSYVFTAPASILEWYVYLRNPGTSGQTIPDLILNETTSIFLDDYYDNRPVIPFYGASSWVVATPLITDFVAGDIITLNIDEVADGAADAVCVGGAVGGGGGGDTTGVVKVTFDAATTTNGQNQNRTTTGTMTAHRAYITTYRPLKLKEVLWDVSSAKTYTVKIYRGWQLTTVFANLGDQVAAGRTAELAWNAADIYLPPGHYVLELTWTGAAVIDDNTVGCSPNSPNTFEFFAFERYQQDTTFYTTNSPALKLAAYLGAEEIL